MTDTQTVPYVPEPVAQIIRAIFGDRGEAWLAQLPELIDERCAAWNLEITGEAFQGGTHSFAAPVRMSDDTPAVLKITVVDAENAAEATALRLYDADGAIELYAYDPASGAMLLEHAAPGRPLVHQPPEAAALEGHPENASRIDIACALYRRLWRPVTEVPGFPPLPRVTDLVGEWNNVFAEARDTAVESYLIAQAVDLCRELIEPDGEQGLVNRDTHLGNIVSAQREPWLLIDPKPLYGERAFDAGFLINKQVQHRPEAGFAAEVVARTAEGLGVAPERARAWAFLRAVENAGWAAEDNPLHGLDRELALAEALR